MSFLNLWALWIAAGVVPLLLLLYFLKLRRREQRISSTLLWKRAVQDLQVNAPFQKLRKNLLLLLQLLILVLAILALTRPIVHTSIAEEQRVVILIDRSASMNTSEGGDTRLEQAKEQARRLLRTLNRTGSRWLSFAGAEQQTQAMVIAFADRAVPVSSFTANMGELTELVAAIEPTDERTNLREALQLAEAYIRPPARSTDAMNNQSTPISAAPPARLVLISDGGMSDLDDTVLRSGTMEIIRVGEARDNVGITRMRSQRNYERPSELSVFVEIENFGPEAVTTDISLFVDDRREEVETLTLSGAVDRRAAGGGEQPEDQADAPSRTALSFALLLDRGAVLEARLSRDDALGVDDEAYLVVPPPRRQRVLVVTEGNIFLDGALREMPLETVRFMTPAQYERAPESDLASEGRSAFDVVIMDRHQTERVPGGNYLFIGSVPPVEGVALGPEVEQGSALIWWDDAHPILRYVALSFVFVGADRQLTVPEDAEVLIEGGQGPSLVHLVSGRSQHLILSFGIEDSTWWKKSFPIFLYNAIQYLGGSTVQDSGAVHPGATVELVLGAGETGRVVTPTGETVEVVGDAGGLAFFGQTQSVGLYRLRAGSEVARRFAVNLEDAAESDIRPRSALTVGGTEVSEAAAIRTATPEIWRWFVGAALLLMIVEWWIYTRRVHI